MARHTVQSSAERAFDNYLEKSFGGRGLPKHGYVVERKQQGRALLSYDVGDRTKVAVVLADDIRDRNGDVGWGVVTWAQCDPAELPPGVTEELRIGVWEDAHGRRIPVTRVRSYQGGEHCSWADITFLLIGPDPRRADWFVRDPSGRPSELAPLLHGNFDRVTELPKRATDTGWHRDGRELWLGPDNEAAYLVKIDDAHDIERWPGATEPIMCA